MRFIEKKNAILMRQTNRHTRTWNDFYNLLRPSMYVCVCVWINAYIFFSILGQATAASSSANISTTFLHTHTHKLNSLKCSLLFFIHTRLWSVQNLFFNTCVRVLNYILSHCTSFFFIFFGWSLLTVNSFAHLNS